MGTTTELDEAHLSRLELPLYSVGAMLWPVESDSEITKAGDELDDEQKDLKSGIKLHPNFSLIQERLYFKRKLAIPSKSQWIPKLIWEFHDTPSSGHSRAYRTYCLMASNFYWKGMMGAIQKYVAACLVCQKHKYEAQSPAGLLQPLPIPKQIWEDVAFDFITGLPRSYGVDCILVVVDRLSKFGHFIPLRHPYTAKSVAEIFTKEVVKLHGIPRTLVSDRDSQI
ncbi:hypothetical protein GH714_019279 [Hevea brasiliensis]|uniref:Integrase catalytic domain-containing protein n=1 Tax=Hevea brasiliensis TaxID=3981 RepID=A0A6A6MVS5_HEVBR|nr:hypothetical protein GH714_019279 [Hevea brasiliensis]